jgi:uncharacterized damage-inducible protein DinB
VADRIPGFRGEFLWELDIVERQTLAVAEAIPVDRYDWRPDTKARSVSEVLVHVAAGNFMLLDFAGLAAPADVYPGLPPEGAERLWAFVRRNDELEGGLREKARVVEFLARSFRAARHAVNAASDDDLASSTNFFGEQTTVRRIYLRMLAHTHEHMGQMIAYVRSMGLPAPWADWRPDRRGED